MAIRATLGSALRDTATQWKASESKAVCFFGSIPVGFPAKRSASQRSAMHGEAPQRSAKHSIAPQRT